MNPTSTTQQIQSSLQLAEKLIKELPQQHEGRNRWLISFGESNEAAELRKHAKPSTADPNTYFDFEPAY